MNVQNLFETLETLESLDRELGLQTKLQAISSTLDSLVQEPANPSHQASLANALSQFAAATAKLPNQIWPSRMELIIEIGGGTFFDPTMSEKVNHTIAINAMTPSVARDYVQKLSKERAAFMSVVTATKNGLAKLVAQDARENPVPAEIAFLIPRDLFDNHLGNFAKELQFINRLVLDFSEAVTGERAPVDLRRLSSSVPAISLAAGLAVMLLIAKIVHKFLEAWKTVQEIREIRDKLRKLGMDNDATAADLKNKINKTITDVVDEVVDETIESSPVSDVCRKNELRIALRNDTLMLYSQIERGLNVEVRVNAVTSAIDSAEDGAVRLEALRSLSVKLQFPQIAGEPILLTPPTDDQEDNGAGAQGKLKKVKKAKEPHDSKRVVEV